MTYTREQLEKMSDFEVNKALEQKLGMYCEDCVGTYIKTMNYLNDWSDIMPLAVEYGINVNPNAGSAYAVLQPKNQFRFCDDGIPNAQRAIACCLLMMEPT